MIELQGEYATAAVYAPTLDVPTIKQIITICDQPFAEHNRIAVMPDVSLGKGAPVGLTMTVTDRVVPYLVGTDIGCGMLVAKIEEKRIDLPKLDSFIRNNIPSGVRVRSKHSKRCKDIDLERLECYNSLDTRKFESSVGTLGSGNHFISIEHDYLGNNYIIIHSGSRGPGTKVATFYQNLAYMYHGGRKQKKVPYELAWLESDLMGMYLTDMKIMIEFAALNRHVILEDICSAMKLHVADEFTTVHNYIDTDEMILRKGAVAVNEAERFIIPINMRDGSLICRGNGKGGRHKNWSAPHGAGRVMSREKARQSFTLSDFKKQMEGIFTTSVNSDTLDECPSAYRHMSTILGEITDTVHVEAMLTPIYNFKAGK